MAAQSPEQFAQVRAGSFRGAAFECEDHDLGGGRRQVVHEYPLRDKPYVEDMGRSARSFKLNIFVATRANTGYRDARDALLRALEQVGPGTLIHPWLGEIQVSVKAYSMQESTVRMGMAAFNVDFIESGDTQFPAAIANTPEKLKLSADNTLLATSEQFQADWLVPGMGYKAQGLQDFVAKDAFEGLEVVSSTFQRDAGLTPPIPLDISFAMSQLRNANVNGILRNPFVLADTVAKLTRASPYLQSLIDIVRIVYSVTQTPSRVQQVKNNDALMGMVRRMAVIETARRTADIQPVSQDTMRALRSRVVGLIDGELNIAAAQWRDPAYAALRDLRTDVINDITVRTLTARRNFQHITQVDEPALVISYRVYGELLDDEIVSRNHIMHPGFVPAPRVLDMLTLDSAGNDRGLQ